jgi:hypothetical protein
MQSNTVTLQKATSMPTAPLTAISYDEAEQEFIKLLEMEELDKTIDAQPSLVSDFEKVVSEAMSKAFTAPLKSALEEVSAEQDAAHRFLQRILYRINRLNLFWYDDLRRYTNERSIYLQMLRNQIEEVWQSWELAQLDVAALQQVDVKQALIDRGAVDVDPPLSEDSRFIREEMTQAGYCHLLAIASFDGLVEASRLSRILGGAANEVQSTLTRVLLEEYGNGRLARKHSTFFAQMLAEFGMHTEPEAYFDLVPWQVLAGINHNFLLTECKRYFLRYNGGLTYFEVAGPAVYRNYLAAAQRLRLSDAAMGYWELHIREDERHGRWMLEDVALPLAQQYPEQAWELVLGYDQERLMSERAATAVVRSIHAATRQFDC